MKKKKREVTARALTEAAQFIFSLRLLFLLGLF